MCIFKHNYQQLIDKSGVYCKDCGKIKLNPCNHNWEEINKHTQQITKFVSCDNDHTKTEGNKTIYYLKCTKCGDIKHT